MCPTRGPVASPRCRRDSVENTIVTPTRNRNVGNTMSVGVQPFQSECSNGHQACPPLLFTMIMNAIVMPRSTSSESIRFVAVAAGLCTDTVAMVLLNPNTVLRNRPPLYIPPARFRELHPPSVTIGTLLPMIHISDPFLSLSLQSVSVIVYGTHAPASLVSSRGRPCAPLRGADACVCAAGHRSNLHLPAFHCLNPTQPTQRSADGDRTAGRRRSAAGRFPPLRHKVQRRRSDGPAPRPPS